MVNRFLDNMYGSRDPQDFIQRFMMWGTSRFFRVLIPQRVLKWVPRNLMQVPVYSLPRVFTPFDPVFWKNLHHLVTGFAKVGGPRGMMARLNDPQLRAFFERYVDSLDSARQEYTMYGFDANDAQFVRMSKFMRVYDAIGLPFTWSDSFNRGQTFVFAYQAGMAALARYAASPTRKNLDKFFAVTGSAQSPYIEQLEILKAIDEGNYAEAARLVATRLANATQFRYVRHEKPLAWQKPGTGAHGYFPIATFARASAFQYLYRDGVQPILRMLSAIKPGVRSLNPVERQRALRAATMLVMWGLMSWLANRLMDALFGTKYSKYDEYGLGTLRYVPGGPVLMGMIRVADAIFGVAYRNDNRAWSALATATHESAKLYVPFYILANRTAQMGFGTGTGSGSVVVDQYFTIPNAIKRTITDAVGVEQRKNQRFVELTMLEMAQRMLFDGATSPDKATVADSWVRWQDAKTDAERDAAAADIQKAIQLYPLGSTRAFDGWGRPVARDPADITDLIPGIEDLAEEARGGEKEWGSVPPPPGTGAY
jgi:hypothetical protein